MFFLLFHRKSQRVSFFFRQVCSGSLQLGGGKGHLETSETSQQIQEGVFFLKLIGSLQVDGRQRPLVETKNPRGSLQLDGREGDKGHFLRPIRELLPEKICHRRRLAGRDAAGGHYALRAGVPSQADGRRAGRGRWVDGGRARRGGMDTWSRFVFCHHGRLKDGPKKDTPNLQKSNTQKEGGCKIGSRIKCPPIP